MKRLVCEMCGGTDLVKDGEVYVCQRCGCMYLIEGARAVAVEEDAREAEERSRRDERLRSIFEYAAKKASRDPRPGSYVAAKLEEFLDELSSLDAGGGVEQYVKACRTGLLVDDDDRFEEALGCADRAFRSIAEKLPDASEVELAALGKIFDFPAGALGARFCEYVRRTDNNAARRLEQCSGSWRARTCALYSSWGGDFAAKGEELSRAHEVGEGCLRKLSFTWALLGSPLCCEGMVDRRCAQDFMDGLTKRILDEEAAFKKESRRVRDELFGAEASSAEEALFTGHIARIEDVERRAREATKKLSDAECIDAFGKLHDRYRTPKDDCLSDIRCKMILESYAIAIRTCTARRDDCSKRVVEHGVFSDETPSWVVDAEAQARIDAQVEEVLGQMIKVYWDSAPGIRRSADEQRERIEQIDAEIEAMKSATCPQTDGNAADEASAKLIEACRKEIESAKREISALGLFGFKRKDELRSRIEELQRTVADEKVKVDERARKEQEAFEAYRSERLKSLEYEREKALKRLASENDLCRSACFRPIKEQFEETVTERERDNRKYHVGSDDVGIALDRIGEQWRKAFASS